MSGVFDLKFNEKVMAIVAMIDHAMAIEEAEEELFDHAANFEV